MEFPKPTPSKPLTFTPPQHFKPVYSELPAEETKELTTSDTPKKTAEKKPFVRKPHLTQRPFQDDRLIQLKNRMRKPKFQNR